MRIISGSLKGRQLQLPKGSAARPTSDRAREALFNILQPCIVGSQVLDLFAGSGALGIEALSRGAAGCIFVELDRRMPGRSGRALCVLLFPRSGAW